MSNHRLRPAAASCIAICIFSFSNPVFSQVVCLSPGEFKNNFIFTPEVVNMQLVKLAKSVGPITFPAEILTIPGNLRGDARVLITGNNIRLDAVVSDLDPIPDFRSYEAFARGKLSLDFAIDCGNTSGETISATIQFKVKRLGRITTFLPTSTALVAVSARFRDTVENRNVDDRQIDLVSVGDLFGEFITIAKIPIPVPSIGGIETAQQESFVINFRKGRVYRFELFAAAKAKYGSVDITGRFARSNFFDLLDLSTLPPDAGIELAQFSIDVAQDASVQLGLLKTQLESLQQAVTMLNTQIQNLDPSTGDQISELQDILAFQGETIATLQENLGVQAVSISEVQDLLALLVDNISELQDTQALINDDISSMMLQLDSINSELVGLQTQINSVRESFDNHTHDYLTGEGAGHNNTSVDTSPPN